jgi:hypothetical protein
MIVSRVVVILREGYGRASRKIDAENCGFVLNPSWAKAKGSCATMPFMNLQAIVNELQAQRDRIQQAIDALERTSHPTSTGKRRGRKPGRHMSADARRRIGLAMKRRWAARKKAA